MNGFWQVIFVAAVIAGSSLATWEADNWVHNTSPPASEYVLNFFGGFVMILVLGWPLAAPLAMASLALASRPSPVY